MIKARVLRIDWPVLSACAAVLTCALMFPPSLGVALACSAVIVAAGVAEYRKRH